MEMIKIIFVVMLLSLIGFMICPVHADSVKSVCVYEPMDLFMDKSLVGIISEQIQTHKVLVKTVTIVDQLSGKTSGCDMVIKIDRAINENYRYTDKTTKYLINGNIITIFTYKTSAVFSPSSGGGSLGASKGKASGGNTFTPMTNWSCEVAAHSSKYHSNYQISNSGYYGTYSGYCDPFKGSSSSSKTNELPYNVIRGSVDLAMTKIGL